MSDFIVPSVEQNLRGEAFALDTLPASFEAGFGAVFDEGLTRNPLATIMRGIDRSRYYDSTVYDEVGNEYVIPGQPSRMLSAEEATTQYGIPGRLTFSEPTPEPVAQQLAKLKREEIERQETMRRAEVGIGTQLTAGLAASLLDPINVASAFIPVVGPARYGLLVERYGAMGARAITGALEGAVGAALVEPIVLSGAQREQADYTMADSLVNLAFGTAMGSGLHLAGGAIGDRLKARETASPFQRQIDDMPRQDQEALLRTAVSQVAEGRAVDVQPVLDAAFTLRGRNGAEIEFTVERARHEGDTAVAYSQNPDGSYNALNWLETEQAYKVEDGRLAQEFRGQGIGLQLYQRVIDEALSKGKQFWSDVSVSTEALRVYDALARRGYTVEYNAHTRISEEAADMIVEAGGRERGSVQRLATDGQPVVKVTAGPDPMAADTRNFRSSLEAAQRTAEPADIRAAEASAARAELEPGAPKPVADDITAIEEELTFMETLMDPERATEFKKADEATKEANMMAKAWEAAVACRVRNS